MHLLAMRKVRFPTHFLAVILLASLARTRAGAPSRICIFRASRSAQVLHKSPGSARPPLAALLMLILAVLKRWQCNSRKRYLTRSAQDVSLFRRVAPSVVLISTAGGIGSGSLLQNNVILTSFHVVDHNRVIAVVMNAGEGSARISPVVRGSCFSISARTLLGTLCG
jgi:hypothetical protein